MLHHARSQHTGLYFFRYLTRAETRPRQGPRRHLQPLQRYSRSSSPWANQQHALGWHIFPDRSSELESCGLSLVTLSCSNIAHYPRESCPGFSTFSHTASKLTFLISNRHLSQARWPPALITNHFQSTRYSLEPTYQRLSFLQLHITVTLFGSFQSLSQTSGGDLRQDSNALGLLTNDQLVSRAMLIFYSHPLFSREEKDGWAEFTVILCPGAVRRRGSSPVVGRLPCRVLACSLGLPGRMFISASEHAANSPLCCCTMSLLRDCSNPASRHRCSCSHSRILLASYAHHARPPSFSIAFSFSMVLR